MSATAADILIDSIHDWGVDTIFGLPGDGINGIMEALRKQQEAVLASLRKSLILWLRFRDGIARACGLKKS